jgi:hypothetical protein
VKRLSVSVLFLLLWALSLSAQAVPTPLQVIRVYHITKQTQVIDNRSVNAQANYYGFSVTGGGVWSVTMQYSDVANTGPWTSFGTASSITNASISKIGAGTGFHSWISFAITGTVDITYSASKDYFIGTTAGDTSVSIQFPITVPQGGTGAITATGATQNLQTINPGTGGVARSLQSRSEDMPNVRDFGAKGDCTVDDYPALQNALNTHQSVIWPKGCYLTTKTLIQYRGDVIYGLSGNDDSVYPGVVIKLADSANVSLLQTAASQGLEPANEYYGIENVMFQCNGPNQTRQLVGNACVDFRGAFIQSYMRHVFINQSFGPGLYTGDNGGDIHLDNIWVINSCTTFYGWAHNPTTPGTIASGLTEVSQVFVEHTSIPNSGSYQFTNDSVRATYGHNILLNRPVSMNIGELHCESGLSCVDLASARSLHIGAISSTNIGDPNNSDPSNDVMIRMMDSATYALQVDVYYGDGMDGNASFIGPGPGVGDANSIQYTGPGVVIGAGYTISNYFAGNFVNHQMLSSHTIAANRFDLQQVGQYSPNEFRINSLNLNSGYTFWRKNTGEVTLGSTSSPTAAEQYYLKFDNFGGNPGGNTLTVGGQQFVLLSPSLSSKATFVVDDTASLRIRDVANIVFPTQSGYIGITNGGTPAVGVNAQVFADDPGFFRGMISQNMLYNGNGIWGFGTNGGGDSAAVFFGNNGSICQANLGGLSQPGTTTTQNVAAHLSNCTLSNGVTIMGANNSFNYLSGQFIDSGDTLQVYGGGFMTGTLRLQGGSVYLTAQSQPTCDATRRLLVWGVSGAPDVLQACLNNGSGYAWTTLGTAASATPGTVTSVGLTVPDVFGISPSSPITSAGSFTVSYATGKTPFSLLGADSTGAVGLHALTSAYLPTSGVTAGVYNNPTALNVDVFGRITSVQQGTGGTGPGAATLATQLLDFSPGQFSATSITFGGSCTANFPCSVYAGGNQFTFTNSVNVTVGPSAPSSDHIYYYIQAGVRTIGFPGTASNSYTCTSATSDCTVTASVSSFPATAFPLYDCIVTSGTFTSCNDDRHWLAQTPLSAGNGMQFLVAAGVTTLNTVHVVNYVSGTTYTFQATDCEKAVIATSSGTGKAFSLPQAGLGGNFANGCDIKFRNKAGTTIITPSTSTIDGAATATYSVFGSGTLGAALISSDGTNYVTWGFAN